jgi:hypothetical protein
MGRIWVQTYVHLLTKHNVNLYLCFCLSAQALVQLSVSVYPHRL